LGLQTNWDKRPKSGFSSHGITIGDDDQQVDGMG
jgi:hypothetical protein